MTGIWGSQAIVLGGASGRYSPDHLFSVRAPGHGLTARDASIELPPGAATDGAGGARTVEDPPQLQAGNGGAPRPWRCTSSGSLRSVAEGV